MANEHTTYGVPPAVDTTTPGGAGDVTGDGSGGGGGGANNFYLEQDPDIYTPIYVVTGFYLAVAIIAPLLVRRGPDRGVIITSIWIGVFCMWLLWFTVYVSQINPLFGPCIKNTTLAFIAHSWGKSAKNPSVTTKIPLPPKDSGAPDDTTGKSGDGANTTPHPSTIPSSSLTTKGIFRCYECVDNVFDRDFCLNVTNQTRTKECPTGICKVYWRRFPRPFIERDCWYDDEPWIKDYVREDEYLWTCNSSLCNFGNNFATNLDI